MGHGSREKRLIIQSCDFTRCLTREITIVATAVAAAVAAK